MISRFSFSTFFFSVRFLSLSAFVAGLALASAEAAPSQDFGAALPTAARAGIGPVMDVATHGSAAVVIGKGRLFVIDVSKPEQPRVVGAVAGLGNTRQVVVGRGVAFVASREDGLFVVSLKDPSAPTVLCRYDPIEWSTGLALSGDVLFVACRQFGVELVDVSRPEKPMHLSTVRTGEAQSVVVRDGWLYAGVWGTSEIVTADVRRPRAPVIVSRVPLDGYGDGVDVRGGFLYAATGHHSRAKHQEKTDPGFGRGHGLEIFSLADPAKPTFVSRLKFPPFYVLGNDWWSVTAAGTHAFVADTHNGVFVVDVKDPRAPVCVAHHQLPVSGKNQLPGQVGGLAPIADHILVAGGDSDLFVVKAAGLASVPTPEPDAPVVVGPPQNPDSEGPAVYKPEGQVYAAALAGGKVVAACGTAGLHVLEARPELRRLSTQATTGVVSDVAALGDRVFAAEGVAGLSIWTVDEAGALRLKGRYRVEGQSVRQVTVPAPGKYAILQVGAATVHIVDVSRPSSPRLALKDTQLGLLYGAQTLDGLVEGRYAAVFWHVTGLHWYDLYGGRTPVRIGQKRPDRFSPLDGICLQGDRVLATRRGGIVTFARDNAVSLDTLPRRKIPEHALAGKPVLRGNRLYVSDRSGGLVSVVNISDPAAPVLERVIKTNENPGRVVFLENGFLLPDGYGGLRYYDAKP